MTRSIPARSKLGLGGVQFARLKNVSKSGRYGCCRVATLQLGRSVFDAKHFAYQDKPVLERVEAVTRREWIHSIRETQIPEPLMEEADIREVGSLMYRQGQQDHDPVSRLGAKIEERRKLMRYEQRAVNQIRKAPCIKK